jgi:hypothetical protein
MLIMITGSRNCKCICLYVSFVEISCSRFAGFAARFVDDISQRIMNTQSKRRLPVIAKVSERTIDRDFRYSRDWGK